MSGKFRFPRIPGSRSSSASSRGPTRNSPSAATTHRPNAAPQTPTVVKSSFNLELALSDLRKSWHSMREGHRTNLRQQVADIFFIAAHLRDDQDDRVLFARQPDWKGFTGKKPNIDKPDEMLEHVIRFSFGFHKGAKSRVTRYTHALTPPFQAGILPDKIAEHVRSNGGIGKMYDAVKTPRSPRSRPPVVTVKLEASDLAKSVLALEPGQEADLRIVFKSSVGQVASAEIVKLKPRETKPVV